MKLSKNILRSAIMIFTISGMTACGGITIDTGGSGGGSSNTGGNNNRLESVTYAGGGKITKRTENNYVAKSKTRLCLINNTGQEKMMKWIRVLPLPGGRINHMVTRNNGSKSCVTIPSDQRIEWTFRDRRKTVRHMSMDLNNYRGNLITYNWENDNNRFEVINCGKKDQRACKVWERIPSCNKGLYEQLPQGICRATKPLRCGARNQRPCKLWERVPSCNSGLREDFFAGKCK